MVSDARPPGATLSGYAHRSFAPARSIHVRIRTRRLAALPPDCLSQILPEFRPFSLIVRSANPVCVVVIAASAGGLDPLRHIIAALPVPCLAAVFVVMHIGPHPSVLPHVLQSCGGHPATFGCDGALIEAGHIYVAPPDHYMSLETHRIRLNQGAKVHYTRPAADPLFISAAETHGQRVMGIVLSGGSRDGAAGSRAIEKYGGMVLVQNPREAEVPSMPRAAMMADHPEGCLLVGEIAHRVNAVCSHG